jgi:uncharacterized metal-binding protein YceD (DUF177 family)
MSDPTAPYSVRFDLGSLSQAREISLTPPAEIREKIAAWAEISGLQSLTATLRLSRLSDGFYAYDGRLEADVVQPCVVTLEPVASHIDREFARRYRVLPARRGKVQFSAEDAVVDPEDDETETIQSPFIDLAAPVLEEFSLGLDPYPRAPGAVYDGPEEVPEPEEHPFAVLEQLKTPPKTRGKSARK